MLRKFSIFPRTFQNIPEHFGILCQGLQNFLLVAIAYVDVRLLKIDDKKVLESCFVTIQVSKFSSLRDIF